MRQRPLLSTACCLFVLLLPACQTLRCDQATLGDPVYLDVSYAADGTPVVVPDSCTVKQGVSVTWQGPLFDDTSFQLEFDGNPGSVTKGSTYRSASSLPLSVESAEGLQRKVRITADNDGEYKYNVHANGHRLDPHIIIER